MTNIVPTSLFQTTLTTTNGTSTLVTSQSMSSYASVSGGCSISVQVSATITSGLYAGSVGVAQVARTFKYNMSTNTVTALTDLVVINSLGGLVIANIAPLVGDLALLGCNLTIVPSTGGAVNVNVTGLNATNIDWTVGMYCFIP